MFNFHKRKSSPLLQPNLHITGKLNDFDEIVAVQQLLDKYSSKIKNYSVLYVSNIFSIELRLDDGLLEFMKDYQNLFTRNGTLKKMYRRAKRAPSLEGT